MSTFVCSVCGRDLPVHTDGGTGYGLDEHDNKVCYDCCGKRDQEYMQEHGKIALYLEKDQVSNWPGTLSFPIIGITKGGHNFGINRYDVWFRALDSWWHGVQYGDDTQVCHCRRLKHEPSLSYVARHRWPEHKLFGAY